MTFSKPCQYCNLNGVCELQTLDKVEMCKKYIEWKNKYKKNITDGGKDEME